MTSKSPSEVSNAAKFSRLRSQSSWSMASDSVSSQRAFRMGGGFLACRLVLLLLLVGPVPCTGQTWTVYNGHEYTLTLVDSDLTDARQWAAQQGGYLVNINDAAEQAWLLATYIPVLPPLGTAWIGFSDELSEGSFIWDSGEPVTYTNWLPNEPNNVGGVENYGALHFLSGGWWDAPATWMQPALVERPAKPTLYVPQPGQCAFTVPRGPGTGTSLRDFAGPYLTLRIMITEIRVGQDVRVEVTNFTPFVINLNGFTLSWWDPVTGTATSAPLSGQLITSVVLYESSSPPPQVPSTVPTLGVLPGLGTTSNSPVTVALRRETGEIIDEVHVASPAGAHPGFAFSNGSDGGLFRGLALRPNGEAGVERIWNLDSDGGSDWTAQTAHSLGLQNTCSGPRGYDPIPVPAVLISEVEVTGPLLVSGGGYGAGGFVEFWRYYSWGSNLPWTKFWTLAVQFQGAAATFHRPWDPARSGASWHSGFGGYCFQDGPSANWLQSSYYHVVSLGAPSDIGTPAETPAGVPYSNDPFWLHAAASPSAIEDVIARPFECVLYDGFGRVVDVVRSTRLGTTQGSQLVHNEPRLPAHWGDFTGAAPYWATSPPLSPLTLSRTAIPPDSNRGSDWQMGLLRTMGLSNTGFGPVGHGDRIDVRMHDGAEGSWSPHGLTFILNAGSARAGSLFSLLFSFGHADGFGPLWGLGADALNYWLTIGTSFPFSGLLGPNGEARFDFPPGSLPPGIPLDCMFILQDPVTGALLARTMVVTYDS